MCLVCAQMGFFSVFWFFFVDSFFVASSSPFLMSVVNLCVVLGSWLLFGRMHSVFLVSQAMRVSTARNNKKEKKKSFFFRYYTHFLRQGGLYKFCFFCKCKCAVVFHIFFAFFLLLGNCWRKKKKKTRAGE